VSWLPTRAAESRAQLLRTQDAALVRRPETSDSTLRAMIRMKPAPLAFTPGRAMLPTRRYVQVLEPPRRTKAVQAVKTAAIRPQTAARTSSGVKTSNGRGPLGYRVHSVAPGVITPCLVEVPGIEPGSFVALMGLLRAQCAVPLLGPTDHAHKSV